MLAKIGKKTASPLPICRPSGPGKRHPLVPVGKCPDPRELRGAGSGAAG